MARKMGIPDAEEVPAFFARTLRIYKKRPADLHALGSRMAKRSGRRGFLEGRKHDAKQATKLAIIGAVIAYEEAAKRQRVAPSAPDAVLAQAYEPLIGGVPATWVWWGAGGVLVAAVGVAIVHSQRNPR